MTKKTPLRSGPDLAKAMTRKALVEESARGETTLSKLARARGMDRSTLYRIRRRAKMGSLFDGRAGNGRPRAVLDARLVAYALRHLADHPKATAKGAWRAADEAALAHGWTRASYKQLGRLLAELPADQRTLLAEGSRALFEQESIVARRTRGDCPLAYVQMDAFELDTYCLDVADGSLFKPWAIAVIDCFSRVILAFCLFRCEPTAADTLLTLRRAILAKGRESHPFYGLFRAGSTDNAQIFRSPEVLDAALRLNVTLEPIGRRHPSQNGVIERFFLTFKTQLLANLAGFAQHAGALAMAQRGAIPWPLLPARVDKFILQYHLNPHAGLGKASPWERWHEALDAAQGLVFDPKEVVSALKLRRDVTVARDGVELEAGRHYTSPKFAGLVGERVTLRLDPEGVGQKIEAYYRGEFLDHLRCVEDDPAVARAVDKARLGRTVELKRFRARLRSALANLPPSPSMTGLAAVAPPRKAPGRRPGKNDRQAPAAVPRFEGHLRGDEGDPVVVLTPEPDRTEVLPTTRSEPTSENPDVRL